MEREKLRQGEIVRDRELGRDRERQGATKGDRKGKERQVET